MDVLKKFFKSIEEGDVELSDGFKKEIKESFDSLVKEATDAVCAKHEVEILAKEGEVTGIQEKLEEALADVTAKEGEITKIKEVTLEWPSCIDRNRGIGCST